MQKIMQTLLKICWKKKKKKHKQSIKTNENQACGILDSCKTSTAKSVIDDTVLSEAARRLIMNRKKEGKKT